MTTKEQLIHEIEQFPESLLSELLKFLLLLKQYYADEELLEFLVFLKQSSNDQEPLERKKEFSFILNHEEIVITDIKKVSSIWDLGHNPVECDVTDGAINHDHYLYNL